MRQQPGWLTCDNRGDVSDLAVRQLLACVVPAHWVIATYAIVWGVMLMISGFDIHRARKHVVAA